MSRYKFGSSDAFIINDLDIKNKIIDYLFNSVNLSKFRYNMLENLNQRTHLEGGRNNTWNGTKAAKYNSYVIYNNLILFCPGYDEDDSMKNCTVFIDKLEDSIVN